MNSVNVSLYDKLKIAFNEQFNILLPDNEGKKIVYQLLKTKKDNKLPLFNPKDINDLFKIVEKNDNDNNFCEARRWRGSNEFCMTQCNSLKAPNSNYCNHCGSVETQLCCQTEGKNCKSNNIKHNFKYECYGTIHQPILDIPGGIDIINHLHKKMIKRKKQRNVDNYKFGPGWFILEDEFKEQYDIYKKRNNIHCCEHICHETTTDNSHIPESNTTISTESTTDNSHIPESTTTNTTISTESTTDNTLIPESNTTISTESNTDNTLIPESNTTNTTISTESTTDNTLIPESNTTISKESTTDNTLIPESTTTNTTISTESTTTDNSHIPESTTTNTTISTESTTDNTLIPESTTNSNNTLDNNYLFSQIIDDDDDDDDDEDEDRKMKYIGKTYKNISSITFINDTIDDPDNIHLFDSNNELTFDYVIEFKSDSNLKLKKTGYDYELPNKLGFVNPKTLHVVNYSKDNVLGKYIICK